MSSQFQAPKGVSEYFPPRSNAFEYVVRTLTSPALAAGYANKLYELFGKERVNSELDEFLKHSFVPRFGGGIGITRLVRALKMSQQ